MKKGVLTSLSLTALFLIPTVYAQEPVTTAFRRLVQQFGQTIGLNINPTDFSAILLGVLLWMILYSVVKQMRLFGPDTINGPFLTGAVALIITVLSFMYLPDDFVNMINLEFGATGATILTLIPFIIMIYFTVFVTDSLLLSRFCWFIFMCYYGYLFLYYAYQSGGLFTNQGKVYLIGLAIGLFFFIFTRNIRYSVNRGKIQATEERAEMKVRKAGVGAKALAKAADVLGGEERPA